MHSCLDKDKNIVSTAYNIQYSSRVEEYVSIIQEDIKDILPPSKQYLARWISLKLLDENFSINNALKSNLNIDLDNNSNLQEKLLKIKSKLKEEGLSLSSLRNNIVLNIISEAEKIRKETCTFSNSKYNYNNKKIDKILTSKKFGIPIMLAFFALIFWITIIGANYPSQLLSNFFCYIQDLLLVFLGNLHFPEFLTNILVYRNVSNSYLGCICNASSDGNIFSFIYIARRFRLFTKNCFQSR